MAASKTIKVTQGEPSLQEIRELVKKTPPSGRKRSIAVLAMVATFGSLLFGYDTGVIAGAYPFMYMPQIAGGFHLSPLEEGLVGAFLAFGAAVGAICGGRISDRFGRRFNITFIAILFILGTIACVASFNLWMLYPCRFILGMAVGGTSATVPVYLSENAPQRIRGPLVAVDQFMIVFGQLLAYSINAIISTTQGGPQVTLDSANGNKTIPWDNAKNMLEQNPPSLGLGNIVGGNGITWHFMLIIATIPAIALWIGIRRMPESSRWYAANGRYVESVGALKRIRNEETDDISAEIEEMVAAHEKDKQQEKWTLRQAFQTKWTRKILFIGICLGTFDQLTGINTAMWYMPKILKAAGFPSSQGIVINVVTGAIAAIASGIGFVAIAKLYRRKVGIIQEAGITISLLVISMIFMFGIEHYLDDKGEVIPGMPSYLSWLVVIAVCIFIFIKQCFTVHSVILSEIFPAKIRGVGQGASVCALWFMNGLVILVFPVMMAHLGASKTYLLFAAINFIAFLFYLKVVPETKLSSLENIEKQLMKKYS